ncbi:MAG TPA: N-methyl-L-tryptophan oxidase [Gemmatimonadales bacterium]|nr:N-methyl-L-tryptophan oxidase [Gemmatimonadales bacterium]
MTAYDVGIVGLGAMGSMAALELARRGRSVIGFDRYRPPHDLGSSHGKSRIIREAYFEHPQYVPFVQRAYRQWARLERDSGRTLLVTTGGLMIGPPGGTLVAGARRSAEDHGLEYEELAAAEVRRRFPVFQPAAFEVGLHEPRAGVLHPEACIAAALELAGAAGAELRYDEPVLEWRAGDGITVVTAQGSWLVGRLIVAAGAWMATALPGAGLPLRVARQPLFWFDAAGDQALVSPRRMPIFIWEWAPERYFYGFPDLGDGVKVAIHHEGETTTGEAVRRDAPEAEALPLRALMAGRTPLLNGPFRASAVCLYTNTPDGDFLIDRSPSDPRVILASPCSGHGFKFAPAIAEALADMVLDRVPELDLSPFSLGRFPGGGAIIPA